MKAFSVKELLNAAEEIPEVMARGWVRTRRDSKGISFVELNDGSCFKNLQIIIRDTMPNYTEAIKGLNTGASVMIKGSLIASEGKGQKWELLAETVVLLGGVDEQFPMQKKGHTVEFLREIAHMRPRGNMISATMRVRSRLAYAVHNFFQQKGFYYIHTPIVTSSDCEGAGEQFRVTTLPDKNPPVTEEGTVDYSQDFFGKKTYLTVSGQLQGEAYASAMGRIYTFGPTFRAENSHTSRHASEFWMIEPEAAFFELEDNMDMAEEMIKYLIADAKEHCADELEFFNKFIDKGLLERLNFVLERPFSRVSYTEAVKILEGCGKKFEYPVKYGVNLQSEHERYLTEEHFKAPTTVYNYPAEIKPFYMRLNDDNTVRAMDLLVPGIGEIIGGSQREERLSHLRANMERMGLDEKEYRWYVELRKWGSVPHSGFGLGFERLIMFVTGMANIRDVIPFPRTPGVAQF